MRSVPTMGAITHRMVVRPGVVLRGWLLPLGLAVLSVTACAEASVQEPDDALVGQASPTPSPRLTAELRHWADFPVDAEPRPAVVLGDVIDGAWRTEEAKIAFAMGRWDDPDQVPMSPGHHAGYPILDAREALALLHNDERGWFAYGDPERYPRLKVQEMGVTTAKAFTDRGRRTLPAWRVTLQDASEPLSVVAVGGNARYRSGLHRSTDTAERGAVADELTLHHYGDPDGVGSCSTGHRIEVAESRTAVVYRIVEVPGPDVAEDDCDPELHARLATLRLTAPLGNRVLVQVGREFSFVTPVVPVGEFEPRRPGPYGDYVG